MANDRITELINLNETYDAIQYHFRYQYLEKLLSLCKECPNKRIDLCRNDYKPYKWWYTPNWEYIAIYCGVDNQLMIEKRDVINDKVVSTWLSDENNMLVAALIWNRITEIYRYDATEKIAHILVRLSDDTYYFMMSMQVQTNPLVECIKSIVRELKVSQINLYKENNEDFEPIEIILFDKPHKIQSIFFEDEDDTLYVKTINTETDEIHENPLSVELPYTIARITDRLLQFLQCI